MIQIDPEAEKVRVKTSNDKTLLHDVYSGTWQTVLRNSFEKGKMLRGQLLTKDVLQKMKHSLYPYMPNVDRA